MLKTLRDLLDRLRPDTAPATAHGAGASAHRLQLATAVMLVEVMRADATFHHDERTAVLRTLRERFALADDEAQRLAELAESTARDATDLYGFTSHIDAVFGMPEKLEMLDQMWRVAYADGVLSAHERHVVWRIADLLHVPPGAQAHARMRAREAAGLPPAAVG